ncbi:MAG TPA: class I SAM-dependent RNA methyltransferase [Trebonia sp.]|nr:class I SAM-dependent RNA methyltransferase [Trebonia sp.]
MGFQVGEAIEVTTEDVAQGGWCVARPAGLPVLFVRHALPGERVLARVTEVTTRFARADAVEVREPSPDRVTPPCPYAHPGGCGGCDWQHATLTAQRALKAAVVAQQLRRLAGIERDVVVEPMPGDETGLGWRTRVQFAVRDDGVAGLRAHRSHRVVGIDDCLIAHPGIRELGIPRHRWPGVATVEAAVGADASAVILTPESSSRFSRTDPADSPPPPPPATLAGAVPAQTVLSRRGGKLTPLRGRPYLTQHAAGRDWRVSAEAFWQVHPAAADTLTAAVLAALEPKPGDTVADLYCGAGLFAGAVAREVGPEGAVTGVEDDQAAVRDARHNLREFPWAQVRRGDVARVARQGGLPRARLVVADPPRAGLAREVIGYLTGDSGATRFGYVSCDPATLARDLGLLLAAGWRLDNLRAFDAFPMTRHVECVATLTR